MTTYEDILVVATKNHTLEDCAIICEVSTRTIQRICERNMVSYGDLRPKGKAKLNTKNMKITYDKLKKKPDLEARIRLLETKKGIDSGRKDHSSSNTQKKNSGENEIFFDMTEKKIDEDFYQEYLKEVIQISTPNIKILTEVRNYLDKKQELKPASQSILEMNPEQIKAISKEMEEIH